MARIFRVIVPVGDIERAATFYGALLNKQGFRVSPGRHYFNCDGVILACFDPRKDGDDWDATPNPDHLYIATDSTLAEMPPLGSIIGEIWPESGRSFDILGGEGEFT